MPFRTRDSGRAWVTSSPASVTVPEVARISPLRAPSKVDFPAPLAPTSATSSACPTSRSIPKSTGPASKPAVRPRTSSRGSGLGAFRISLTEVGLDHALVLEHHLRLALGQDATRLEHDGPAADPDDHAHHVLDQEHSDSGRVDRPHHVERFVDLDIVESRHDLIEEQQV